MLAVRRERDAEEQAERHDAGADVADVEQRVTRGGARGRRRCRSSGAGRGGHATRLSVDARGDMTATSRSRGDRVAVAVGRCAGDVAAGRTPRAGRDAVRAPRPRGPGATGAAGLRRARAPGPAPRPAGVEGGADGHHLGWPVRQRDGGDLSDQAGTPRARRRRLGPAPGQDGARAGLPLRRRRRRGRGRRTRGGDRRGDPPPGAARGGVTGSLHAQRRAAHRLPGHGWRRAPTSSSSPGSSPTWSWTGRTRTTRCSSSGSARWAG